MNKNYQPQLIEPAIQKSWDENKTFVATEKSDKPKFYCLSMLPYPSGHIHMGHARNYTIGDVIARYQRMLGKNVLQPLGWDAFGLPAENAALQNNLAPSEWTYKNIEQMRATIKQLGFAIDWTREVTTCRPEYYRFEQELFLKMYAKGLAYKKKSFVNWDPVDQTVLANEQVVNGCGWRSGAPVERKEIAQWFLKITAYADELLNDLDKLTGWPEQVRTMQRNWIGRSEGLELDFKVANRAEVLTVFTTRPDTIFGATFIALAPQHPLAILAANEQPELAAFLTKCRNIKHAEADLATLPKEGFATNFFALNPLNNELIPILIANYVLMEYGSGAVMSVPAHDERDFEFAKLYNLPIKPVIKPVTENNWDYVQAAYVAKGILINSGEYTGLDSQAAFTAIANQHGKLKINFRLRDWGISRQRYWGTPIPMVNCAKCGAVPVNPKDLPVVLPEGIKLKDPRSPLHTLPEFINTTCPKCGGAAKRETDTFDTFMESSWYFARYCCPNQNQTMVDERVNYWMPVDQYIGGIEHAVMHLLYARFIYKVMRDEGLVRDSEPFTNLLTQGMVLKDGSKMSKSKGNTVAPAAMIEKYGVDTVRLFMIFASPPEQSLDWSDSGVEGAHRFLKKLWNFAATNQAIFNQQHAAANTAEQQKYRQQIHLILQQANFDMERQQFNTVVSAAMKLLNLLQEIPAANNAAVLNEGCNILLRLLHPITPHITQQLWQELKFVGELPDAPWPVVDPTALQHDTIELVIQVNGKVRGKIVVAATADKPTIEKLVIANNNVAKTIAGATIKKFIVIQNKLVNLVI